MNLILQTAFYITLVVALVTSDHTREAPILAPLAYPRYAYNYAIYDPITKDNKAHWETKAGDVVKGAYSLVEPDGSLRIVEYAANDATGFHAKIKKLGPNLHPIQDTKDSLGKIVLDAPNLALVDPVPSHNYGFGAASLAVGLPKETLINKWSIPWDPHTGTYGGWVPHQANRAHSTIFSKKYINGKLYKWSTGPIPLSGRTLIVKTKH